LPINIVVLDTYTHTTHCYFDNIKGMKHLKSEKKIIKGTNTALTKNTFKFV